MTKRATHLLNWLAKEEQKRSWAHSNTLAETKADVVEFLLYDAVKIALEEMERDEEHGVVALGQTAKQRKLLNMD